MDIDIHETVSEMHACCNDRSAQVIDTKTYECWTKVIGAYHEHQGHMYLGTKPTI